MNLAWSSIAWLHVLVAALATFFLGAIWYTALGKLRQRGFGYTDAQMAALQQRRPPAVFLACMLVCYLLIGAVFELLLRSLGLVGAGTGALFGGLLWTGVALPIGITAWVATDRPIWAFGIDFGFQLVFLPLMGAILGGWQ